MRGVFLSVCAMAALNGWSSCDRPDVRLLGGTGYHTNGWFTFGATLYADGKDSLLLDKKEEFVLSPRYPAPVRKVVLSVCASSAANSRTLWVRPLVGGLETSTSDFACVVEGTPTTFTNVGFDFKTADQVDAVRIGLGDSGIGTWRIGQVLVLFGEKDAAEEGILREFARQVPTPENLRAVTFTTNSLSLAVDEVAGAAGYRFAVDRLEGFPRTERREDFVSAPQLSTGWGIGASSGVVLGRYSGSGYYDSKTAADKSALKIEVRESKGGRLEILSPEAPERLSEYSFFGRATSAGNDRVSVYGRKTEENLWQSVSDPVVLTETMTGVTNVLPESVDVRQVKFVFDAAAKVNGAIDSLRIVYGGNESRTPVLAGNVKMNCPSCELDDLAPNARYAFRAQAVADPADVPPCRDSSWTEEQVVDLSWATVTVTPPTDIEWETHGATLTIRWTAVANADHYLLDVVPLDDPEHPVVAAAKATGTSLDVTVPAVGEYAITVRAVSPGGLSAAASRTFVGEVALGGLSSVSLTVVDRQTVEASWAKVPLAEGYQVRLVAVGAGTRSVVESVRTAETRATFRTLDPNGRYVVTVVPLPSEGESQGATSPTLDLSSVRLRETGAVPLSRVRTGAYAESFDSLSNVSAKVETRFLPLDGWQLYKGSGEAESILYSAKTNFTAGGIYVLSDEARTLPSFMLGTQAAGTYGCSVGVALLNDTDGPVGVGTLSFDTVQRTFRNVAKSYVLEWLLTVGSTSLDAAGDWRRLEIPPTAPYVAGDAAASGGYRQSIEIAEGLPERIPASCVLILRLRHEKVASGPAMGIDNVRLEIDKRGKGFGVIVR